MATPHGPVEPAPPRLSSYIDVNDAEEPRDSTVSSRMVRLANEIESTPVGAPKSSVDDVILERMSAERSLGDRLSQCRELLTALDDARTGTYNSIIRGDPTEHESGRDRAALRSSLVVDRARAQLLTLDGYKTRGLRLLESWSEVPKPPPLILWADLLHNEITELQPMKEQILQKMLSVAKLYQGRRVFTIWRLLRWTQHPRLVNLIPFDGRSAREDILAEIQSIRKEWVNSNTIIQRLEATEKHLAVIRQKGGVEAAETVGAEAHTFVTQPNDAMWFIDSILTHTQSKSRLILLRFLTRLSWLVHTHRFDIRHDAAAAIDSMLATRLKEQEILDKDWGDSEGGGGGGPPRLEKRADSVINVIQSISNWVGCPVSGDVINYKHALDTERFVKERYSIQGRSWSLEPLTKSVPLYRQTVTEEEHNEDELWDDNVAMEDPPVSKDDDTNNASCFLKFCDWENALSPGCEAQQSQEHPAQTLQRLRLQRQTVDVLLRVESSLIGYSDPQAALQRSNEQAKGHHRSLFIAKNPRKLGYMDAKAQSGQITSETMSRLAGLSVVAAPPPLLSETTSMAQLASRAWIDESAPVPQDEVVIKEEMGADELRELAMQHKEAEDFDTQKLLVEEHDKDELDQESLDAMYLLRLSKMRELRAEILAYLNFVRAAERRLAVDDAELKIAGWTQRETETGKDPLGDQSDDSDDIAHVDPAWFADRDNFKVEFQHDTWDSAWEDCSVVGARVPDDNLPTIVDGASGWPVVYDVAIQDYDALQTTLLRIGSLYLSRTGAIASGVENGDKINRKTVMSDLLESEAAYQQVRAKLIGLLIRAYESAGDRHVALGLASRIRSLIVARPELDLESLYFIESYVYETAAMEELYGLLSSVFSDSIESSICVRPAASEAVWRVDMMVHRALEASTRFLRPSNPLACNVLKRAVICQSAAEWRCVVRETQSDVRSGDVVSDLERPVVPASIRVAADELSRDAAAEDRQETVTRYLMNAVELLTLREDLITTLYESDLLDNLYSWQASLMGHASESTSKSDGRTGQDVGLGRRRQLDSAVMSGQKIAIAAIDTSLSEIRFDNVDDLKRCMRDGGLKIVRAAAQTQRTYRSLVAVAALCNDVMIEPYLGLDAQIEDLDSERDPGVMVEMFPADAILWRPKAGRFVPQNAAQVVRSREALNKRKKAEYNKLLDRFSSVAESCFQARRMLSKVSALDKEKWPDVGSSNMLWAELKARLARVNQYCRELLQLSRPFLLRAQAALIAGQLRHLIGLMPNFDAAPFVDAETPKTTTSPLAAAAAAAAAYRRGSPLAAQSPTRSRRSKTDRIKQLKEGFVLGRSGSAMELPVSPSGVTLPVVLNDDDVLAPDLSGSEATTLALLRDDGRVADAMYIPGREEMLTCYRRSPLDTQSDRLKTSIELLDSQLQIVSLWALRARLAAPVSESLLPLDSPMCTWHSTVAQEIKWLRHELALIEKRNDPVAVLRFLRQIQESTLHNITLTLTNVIDRVIADDGPSAASDAHSVRSLMVRLQESHGSRGKLFDDMDLSTRAFPFHFALISRTLTEMPLVGVNDSVRGLFGTMFLELDITVHEVVEALSLSQETPDITVSAQLDYLRLCIKRERLKRFFSKLISTESPDDDARLKHEYDKKIDMLVQASADTPTDTIPEMRYVQLAVDVLGNIVSTILYRKQEKQVATVLKDLARQLHADRGMSSTVARTVVPSIDEKDVSSLLNLRQLERVSAFLHGFLLRLGRAASIRNETLSIPVDNLLAALDALSARVLESVSGAEAGSDLKNMWDDELENGLRMQLGAAYERIQYLEWLRERDMKAMNGRVKLEVGHRNRELILKLRTLERRCENLEQTNRAREEEIVHKARHEYEALVRDLAVQVVQAKQEANEHSLSLQTELINRVAQAKIESLRALAEGGTTDEQGTEAEHVLGVPPIELRARAIRTLKVEDEITRLREENHSLTLVYLKMQSFSKLRDMALRRSFQRRFTDLQLDYEKVSRSKADQAEESRIKEENLRAVMEETQGQLAQCQTRVDSLKREVDLQATRKLRLAHWKVVMGTREKELRSRIAQLETAKNLHAEALVETLQKKEREIRRLRDELAGKKPVDQGHVAPSTAHTGDFERSLAVERQMKRDAQEALQRARIRIAMLEEKLMPFEPVDAPIAPTPHAEEPSRMVRSRSPVTVHAPMIPKHSTYKSIQGKEPKLPLPSDAWNGWVVEGSGTKKAKKKKKKAKKK